MGHICTKRCLVHLRAKASRVVSARGLLRPSYSQGNQPMDLPIERPSVLEFIVNMKTAQALGLSLRPRRRGDRVKPPTNVASRPAQVRRGSKWPANAPPD